MEIIKKYLISLSISFSLIFIFSFFINIFNYFEIFNTNIYKIFLTLLTGLSVLIGGFILGKNVNNKGYLHGLIYGIIIILIMLFISIIFKNSLTISSIFYYLIMIIVSFISSIIGINKNIKEKKQ